MKNENHMFYSKGHIGKEKLYQEIATRANEPYESSPEVFTDEELEDPTVEFVVNYLTSRDNITLQSHGLDLSTVKKWTVALAKNHIPSHSPNGEAKIYTSLRDWASEVQKLLPDPNKPKNFKRKKATE